MCRYEVPVVQWLFCGHAHAYPPVKKHPSYPAPPAPPRPGQPSTSSSGASECNECSQGLLSQYYARPMFVEAWCAGCAWAAYAYHPLYAVPPEVYGATNVSSARGIQHAQCARPASKDHTNEQRITPMKHQDVSSLPPWVPPGSACAPKGSPGWHGGAPAGVTAPSTYADCLKMPRDRRTARKIPNGHGHGAPASSRSDAKCKDGSNAGEKPTKTDSQTAGKPVRGPSSKRTHGSGTVKFPESSPEPVTVPVKSKAQNQKSSRRSRGRASHSSTETVRPVRDA